MVYVLSEVMAPVGMVVLGTVQLVPEEIVCETPGPVIVQVPSTPEADTVSVDVPPVCTRVGEAEMLGTATPHACFPTVTELVQDAVAPPALTDIAYVPAEE